MTLTLRDRYRGAMVGVLCGDALGAPYETWDAERIKADFEIRGGLVPFAYENPWAKDFPNLMGKTFEAGRPTDDSDHTAALAESLIAMKGVDQEDIFKRLRHVVFGHVSPLWGGKAVGAGQTTRKMLRVDTWVESQALGSEGAFPSNGSLMRSTPMALFVAGNASSSASKIRTMSEVTHRHPVAGSCCVAYVSVMEALLGGLPPEDAIRVAQADLEHEHDDNNAEAVETLIGYRVQPRDPEKWPGRGAAVITLHAALWALSNSEDFREGITRTVAIGGDTDTYGAVAGGLLGAHFGLQSIPQDWQDVLMGREKMIELADRLYDIANPS